MGELRISPGHDSDLGWKDFQESLEVTSAETPSSMGYET